MDDRGYVAQALFDRLSGDGVRFRILGDSDGYPERASAEVQLAVPGAALAGMPRAIARYAQELDLQLVHLAPEDSRAWRCVLGWSDEVGRPRFVAVRICSDYCRGMRAYLRAEELLAGSPDILFIHGVIDAVERDELPAERAAWLCSLWNEDPRAAIEEIGRFWPDRAHTRLVAQAAKHGEWAPMRERFADLRRALRRRVWPDPADIAARLTVLGRSLAQPARARIAFMGRESIVRSTVLAEVATDLAPLGLTLFESGPHTPRPDLRVIFDPLTNLRSDDIVVLSSKGVAAAVVAVERAILRWLECRVERRHPDAVVGENPFAAHVLQFAVRHRVPFIQTLMGCDIRCRLGSPVLMPHPLGIVIEAGTSIGSRVTVMHQVSLLGAPTIEDNVTLGPGAKVIGQIRIGRGATIGANAVVTQDVPSHDKVVVEKRRTNRWTVVNA